MHKLVLFLSLFFGSAISVLAESTDITMLSRIDLIKIHVRSCTVEIINKFPEGDFLAKKYPAGTPTAKNAKDVPFKKMGSVYRIVLNPRYIPTKKHIAQEEKRGKKVKTYYPPGDKDNPLGTMKLYFTFNGIDPAMSYGMHTTNQPDSVGHRVSEGCARISTDDAREILGIILKQDGYSADELFQEMDLNPTKQISIILKNKPRVIYLND